MKHIPYIVLLLFFAACSKSTIDSPGNDLGGGLTNPLDHDIITPTFDYSMGGTVNLKLEDYDPDAIYTIYSFDNDHCPYIDVFYLDENGEKQMLSMEMPSSECWNEITNIKSQGDGINFSIDLPGDVEELFVRRVNDEGVAFTCVDLCVSRPADCPINFDTIMKSRANKSTASSSDFSVLWGVNTEGILFTIDLQHAMNETDLVSIPSTSIMDRLKESGAYSVKDANPDLQTSLLDAKPMSIAMNDNNSAFYTVGTEKLNGQYPLYKYNLGNMVEGNGTVESVQLVGKLDFAVSGLEFADGFLYLSTINKIFKIAPIEGSMIRFIQEFDIPDVDDFGTGDLVQEEVVREDDTPRWYMATASGLFSLSYEEDNTASLNRITSPTLGEQFSSIAFSKFQYPANLWLANEEDNSSIFSFDPETEKMIRRYRLNHPISDFSCANALPGFLLNDVFPNESCDAYYKVCFPSMGGCGSIAFEDVYPKMNDYDFNDLVVDYRYDAYYSGPDNPTLCSVQMEFDVVHVTGASYHNGFGFTFEGIKPEDIKYVSITNGGNFGSYYSISSKGIESGHSADQDAVIMLFEDQYTYRLGDTKIGVTIQFNESNTVSDLYDSFDPFIVVNNPAKYTLSRSFEIHRAGKSITSLGDPEAYKTFYPELTADENLDNNDILSDNADGDFRGNKTIGGYTYIGFPWVLVLPHKFSFPSEEAPVTIAYTRFKDWANLSELFGESPDDTRERYEDWYTDKTGYMRESYIDQ